ncbi:MAG: hypothetical protein IKT00_06530 [Prevotella sp.]|nr:hypothetical protein [Prevotella sp.]
MKENQTNLKTSPEEASPSNNDQWMKVTVGAVAGILLGGGSIYAATQADDTSTIEDALATAGTAVGDIAVEDNSEAAPESEQAAPSPAVAPTIYTSAPVAHVSNNLSFPEAFASARAQVGPGGVFSWHGGVYGTYYETEWDAMSDGQRMEYAQSVHTEVTPRVYIEQHPIAEVHYHEPDVVIIDHHEPDVVVINHPDDDMHVVARGTVGGHEAVALDVTGNDDADVMIIDADDSHSLTEPDVVIDTAGNVATVGDIVSGAAPIQQDYSIDTPDPVAHSETPDVAPEMPDYMDDAGVVL